MTKRRWLVVALGAAAVLLIAGRAVAGVYADYLWYESLGALALWRTRMTAVLLIRGGSMLVGALFAFANLYAVRRSVVSLVFPRRLGNLEIGEELPGRYLLFAAIILAVVLGTGLAMSSDNWTSFALATSGKPFDESEPYFGNDLGFFTYWLPLENVIWMWAFFLVIVVSIAVALLYALTPSLKWQRGGFYASVYVRRHFTALVGLLLLMLAWSFRLDMYTLLVQGSAADNAFGWVDHHVGIPADLILSVATLGAALIVLWTGLAGRMRLAGIAVLATIVLSLLGREVAPTIVAHTGTDAHRVTREQSYVATRAAYTRRAFGVDRMPRTDSAAAFVSAAAALPSVSVWDVPALARAVDASRAASPDDGPTPVGWHAMPGELLADVINAPSAGASSRAPWTSAQIIASDADERGAPLRADAMDRGAIDDDPVEAPLVYPGASNMFVVADSLRRSAGTSLESGLSRFAIAWSAQNFKLMSGDLPQPHPTVMVHRDIRDRLEHYMPFFAQGRRVEPILLGDTLYWTMDLYSASGTYPLSRHAFVAGEDRSYLRHAATAVVQASTGEIVVVPDSTLDPIAATWVRKLRSLFGTWNMLPPRVRSSLPPAVDELYAQANAFGQYGATGESTAPRHVPLIDGADTALAGDLMPFSMLAPHAEPVTAMTLPLIDDTDRLRGLMVATGGQARATSWYSLTVPGPRWGAILDKLRSVDSAGSAAREGPLAHGRVRSLPVRGGVAFVQPSYRWRSQTVPTVNRVALLAGDSVRAIAPPLSNTVRAALSAPGTAPSGTPAARSSAAALYAAMRDAMRRGDWAAFGRAFEALGRALGDKRVGGTTP
ncbi:MAG TPA: UPF0182 family protein [Gemmatimonadaceae bacterium]|jgi:hypothetical protein|nr:UPF0182 family protein [Gemmatimonadaceae bacterium]